MCELLDFTKFMSICRHPAVLVSGQPVTHWAGAVPVAGLHHNSHKINKVNRFAHVLIVKHQNPDLTQFLKQI